MYRYQLAALAAVAGVASGSAVLPSQPKQTGKFIYPLDQVSPRPTNVPESPLELMRRQGDEKTTVLQAPDNICGYISDRPGASFFCPADFNCFLFTAEATLSGAVACCNPESCNLRLTCIDYEQIEASSCDSGCMVDAFTLKCTDTDFPYCNTAVFPGSIYDYWCNDLSVSTAQEADTTYSGQTGRTFSDLVLDETATTAGDDDFEFGARTSAAADEDATPPSVDDDDSDNQDEEDDGDDDDDDIGGGGGGGGGSKKKSNTGAIAGGVVGGVAALGLIGAGAFTLMRKKRKQDAAKTPGGANNGPVGGAGASTFPPTSPNMTQQQNTPPPMGMGYGQHQSVYDPNYAQQMQGQQMQGQYGTPPPGSVYPPKQEFNGFYNNGQQMPPQQQQLQPQVNAMAVPIDRNDSTSPMSDVNRMSMNPPLASPTLSHTSSFVGGQQQQGYAPPGQQQGFQQTQPTIHEAGGQQVDHHRGQMHELGS